MASYIETTAFSLRKGNHVANMNFTGVSGEIVADLGNEQAGVLGTDINTTLRLHNGITKGGIPMCRADTRNISTKVLAENRALIDDKNLAYADLSNIEVTTEQEAINNIVNTLDEYGIVNKSFLKEETDKLALKDMSNVITSTLASGRGRGIDGNLAYADTSNINTADLVSTSLHYGKEEGDWPLAYADMKNVDTTNLTKKTDERPETMQGPVLATADLLNVDKEDLADVLFNQENELYLERTLNKDTVIPEELSDIDYAHYPSTFAVNKYVTEQIEKGKFLKSDYSNSIDYEVLYSNGENRMKYDNSNKNIIEAGQGFELTNAYYVGKFLNEKTEILFTVNLKDEVNPSKISDFTAEDLEIIPSLLYGSTDYNGTYSINIIDLESDEILSTITFELTSEEIENLGLYRYSTEITNISNNGKGIILGTEYSSTPTATSYIPLCIRLTEQTEDGGIASFYFVPARGDTSFENEEVIVYNTNLLEGIEIPENAENGKINLTSIDAFPEIGPAALAKTNLTNLMGMSKLDQSAEKNTKWRIRQNLPIKNVLLDEIEDEEYCKIANNGQVWNAIKNTKAIIDAQGGVPDWQEGKEYQLTPNISKVFYEGNVYYCKEAHTAGEEFDPTKWTLLGNDTYEQLKNKDQDISLALEDTDKYPSNKAVVDYVKSELDKTHIPGHYYGQGDILVTTENNLPGASDPSTEYDSEPKEGMTAAIENYNNTNKPAGARYTNGEWKFAEWTLQNGVYVYILNLGKSYNDGPGTATWNDFTNKFDIAPDKFQVPDNKTLDLNEVTGAIQIVESLQTKLSYVDTGESIRGLLDIIDERLDKAESRLDAAVIPAPQFFTGTGEENQELELTDDVEFDLYVNGVFQYPLDTVYTFDKETKKVTLQFVVEDTRENGIAVIYRGFRKPQEQETPEPPTPEPTDPEQTDQNPTDQEQEDQE